jgi:hypothetical protein
VAKSDPVERALSELKSLRASNDRAGAVPLLRQHLSSKQNLVAAKAAQIVGEWELSDLESDLISAFERFMKSGADKGCGAKTSIARALDQLRSRQQEVFITGIHHHQPEAAWGPPVDVAAELRGVCAAALVRLNYREVLSELAVLLMDSEPAARIGAAQAIAYRGGADDAGAALLRLKLLARDDAVDVQVECLSALLRVAPRTSLAFVADHFLDNPRTDDDLKQSTLLSIAEARTPDAFEFLRKRVEAEIRVEARRPLLLAIATMRISQAMDYLLNIIEREPRASASASLEALKLHKNNEQIKEKVAAAVTRRQEQEIQDQFNREWRV